MSSIRRLKNIGRAFNILAVETSCDDTSVCILNSRRIFLAEVTKSQHKIHAQHFGIVPYLAKEAHRTVLPEVISESLSAANLDVHDIDIFACTRGPGIAGSLSVGFDATKTLARVMGKPFYPVNHMEAHALITRYGQTVEFPFLCLLISGGHTLLIYAHDLGNYTQLGTTLDDSVGEAIDKAARMIGINYDEIVGPAAGLVQCALSAGNNLDPNWDLGIAKSSKLVKSLDFSFSGLKTAFADLCRSMEITASLQSNLAKLFLDSCSDQLISVLKRSLKILPQLSSRDKIPLVVAGGVARNDFIFSRIFHFGKTVGMPVYRPLKEHCIDNGSMIGWTALEYVLRDIEPTVAEDIIVDWRLQDLKIMK